MWMFEKYKVYEDMNYIMCCVNDWAKKMFQLLTMVIENENRIRELEKEIEQLKKGKKNEKGLSGKETRKKQSRSKAGKL